MVLCSFFNCCFDWHTCCIPVNTSLISTHNPRNCSICTSLYELLIKLYTQALVARTTPLFTNFLFTNLFSIKKNYFFIISSLFPYFNLFVSIFIQSRVNNNLHVRPYIDTNNPQGMQLGRFKNRTPARFEYIYCTLFPLCHSN